MILIFFHHECYKIDNHFHGSVKKMLSKYLVLIGFRMSLTREHIYRLKWPWEDWCVFDLRSCLRLVPLVINKKEHRWMIMNECFTF